MRERWQELAKIVTRFGGRRVAVVGDLVLDRFWYGTVQRVSREAPVPIVRLAQTRLLPGCAANTAWNIASLGATPVAVGALGTDREGDELLELMDRAGMDTSLLVRSPSWITPTKTRVLAGSYHGHKQQMVRVDSGEENAFDGALVSRLKGGLDRALAEADALIVSDYGFGTASALQVRRLVDRVPISALDSRFDMGAFAGAGLTTATPNEEEFELTIGKPLGDDSSLLESEGECLCARLGLKALLVTRGSKGMSLFEAGHLPLHLSVVGSDQVVDVTGAGDTVISTYVLSLCAGATFPQAAAIANVAGGIVVQKHGTATTNQEELTHTLQEWGEGRL